MLSPDRQANIDKAVKALYDYIDSLPPGKREKALEHKEGSYFMKNAVKYKDGSYLMKGSVAYQLYDDARYHKDAGVRKEAEKRLKKHMEEVNAKYKELHGL